MKPIGSFKNSFPVNHTPLSSEKDEPLRSYITFPDVLKHHVQNSKHQDGSLHTIIGATPKDRIMFIAEEPISFSGTAEIN
jgi:hypothetical protein